MPNFHKGLIDQERSHKAAVSVSNAKPDDSPPLSIDRIAGTRIPELSVRYHGTYIDKVLLDGGAGVNIITQAAYRKYGLTDWEPAPFLVWMADQRRVQPVGLY